MALEDKAAAMVGEGAYPIALGPYLLLHRLAHGGMGDVHLAKHGGLAGIEKVCVVKTLRKPYTESDEYVRRFMDEARVVVHLAHRNICSVFDVGRVDDRYYLAMEYIAGRDLRTLLDVARVERVTLSPAVCFHVVSEVLEALDYAHRLAHPVTGEPLHLVHRDVSPANVMISLEGEVKLIDFGLALSDVKEQRTEPHTVMGKIAYMSPEQLNSEPLDGRADLFSAAVMLYELYANDRYYGDMTDGDVLLAAASGEHVPRNLFCLDEELQAIFGAALHKARELRTTSCGELRQELVRYQLKRQMSAGSRELRELMDKLFPSDRAVSRQLLSSFANVRGLKLASEAGAVPAARPRSTTEAAVVPLARPAAPPPRSLVVEGVALPPEAAPSSSESTKVAKVALERMPAHEAKPGTPRPELLARLGLEPPSGEAANPFEGPHNATEIVARPLMSASERKRAGRALLGAAAVATLVGGAALVVMLPGGPPPVVVAEPTPAVAPASEAAAVVESEGAGAEAPIVVESEGAGAEAPIVVGSEQATAPIVVEEVAIEVDVEPPVEKPKPAAKARAKPARVKRGGGKLRPGAKPEEKLRYLDKACRAKAPCAGELVDMFRAMRVDDARTFWPRVDQCVAQCGR